MTEEKKILKTDCWEIASNAIQHSARTLLYGPPGTGKTHIAIHCDTQPVYTVTLTEETPDSELRGHYIPSENGFVWQDGPAIKAWREGARLILNEIDKASPQAQQFLNVILDDAATTARLNLPNNEEVRPALGFKVVATMNGEPLDLPESLRDRFPVKVNIDKIHPEAIAALPADLRDIAIKTSEITDLDRRLSVRSWAAYADLRKHIEADLAGAACFGATWTDLSETLLLVNAPEVV